MNLEVLLEPAPNREKVSRCKVARFSDNLPEKYQDALQKLLQTPYDQGGLTDMELVERLREAGLSVGATVVNNHRKGRCACV